MKKTSQKSKIKLIIAIFAIVGLLGVYVLTITDLVFSNSYEALIDKAEELYEFGDYNKSLKYYIRADKNEPSIELRMRILDTVVFIDDKELARELISNYIEDNPTEWDFYEFSASYIYGNNVEAEEVYKSMFDSAKLHSDSNAMLAAAEKLVYEHKNDSYDVLEILFANIADVEIGNNVRRLLEYSDNVEDIFSKKFPSIFTKIYNNLNKFYFGEDIDEIHYSRRNSNISNVIFDDNKFEIRLGTSSGSTMTVECYSDSNINQTVYMLGQEFLFEGNTPDFTHTDFLVTYGSVITNLPENFEYKSVHALELYNLNINLDILERFENLIYLGVRSSYDIDLSELPDLPYIKKLKVEGFNVTGKLNKSYNNIDMLSIIGREIDLSSLDTLDNLVSLTIDAEEIKGTTSNSLRKIKYFELDTEKFNEDIFTIDSEEESLLSVEDLVIKSENSFSIEEINFINRQNIDSLTLTGLKGNIEDLSNFEYLSSLTLYDAKDVSGNISSLAKSEKLSRLLIFNSSGLNGELTLSTGEHFNYDTPPFEFGEKYYNVTYFNPQTDENASNLVFNEDGTFVSESPVTNGQGLYYGLNEYSYSDSQVFFIFDDETYGRFEIKGEELILVETDIWKRGGYFFKGSHFKLK